MTLHIHEGAHLVWSVQRGREVSVHGRIDDVTIQSVLTETLRAAVPRLAGK